MSISIQDCYSYGIPGYFYLSFLKMFLWLGKGDVYLSGKVREEAIGQARIEVLLMYQERDMQEISCQANRGAGISSSTHY